LALTCAAVPRSSNRERITQNFALEGFQLTDADLARIDVVDR
jgi:diketogulonate reductase-like aldo/keto reductase